MQSAGDHLRRQRPRPREPGRERGDRTPPGRRLRALRGSGGLLPDGADGGAVRRSEAGRDRAPEEERDDDQLPRPSAASAHRGLDAPLRGLFGRALEALLRDYETYRLDLSAGGLDRGAPGGYAYVAEVFGRAPVVAGVPSALHRDASLPLYASLGARMTVLYHETGTKMEEPFEWVDGLLVRPSDFSVTRWPVAGHPQESFWWTMLDTSLAASYDPAAYLEGRLADWTGPRTPLVTALIHEDNFYRKGATPWALIYYEDADKGRPRTPPYDLNAPGPSEPRSPENQAAIWAAYERLVAYAAEHLDVVTSEDLVALAESPVGKETP